jgi:putative DNA primase/helicase
MEGKPGVHKPRSDETAAPSRSLSGVGRRSLPVILVSDRQLRDLTRDALRALLAANDPPLLFDRAGRLTHVRITESGPVLEPLTEASLRHRLARTANWERTTFADRVATFPPVAVVRDILALPELDGFPPLDRLVEAPTFAPDGSLLTTAGYQARARVWFHAGPSLGSCAIPEEPSPKQIAEARALLLDEMLVDFPFVDDASRAHALAAMLLPFVRDCISGPTPLHLIEAPTPGTGKGLLANLICIPATGRGATVMAEGQSDEEWRKRITAMLLAGPVFVVLDNLRRRLDAGALAARSPL